MWVGGGVPRPTTSVGVTAEEYMAGVARAAAERAMVEQQTGAFPTPPARCHACTTTAGVYSSCSCVEDCGSVDCWRGPVQGRWDMPGCLRQVYPVPQFKAA